MKAVLLHHLSNGKKRASLPKALAAGPIRQSVGLSRGIRIASTRRPGLPSEDHETPSPITPQRKRKVRSPLMVRPSQERASPNPRPSKSTKTVAAGSPSRHVPPQPQSPGHRQRRSSDPEHRRTVRFVEHRGTPRPTTTGRNSNITSAHNVKPVAGDLDQDVIKSVSAQDESDPDGIPPVPTEEESDQETILPAPANATEEADPDAVQPAPAAEESDPDDIRPVPKPNLSAQSARQLQVGKRRTPPKEIMDTDSEAGRSAEEAVRLVEEGGGLDVGPGDVGSKGNVPLALEPLDPESEYVETYEEEMPEEEGGDAGNGMQTLTQMNPVDLKSLLRKQENVLKERNNELFHHRTDIFRSPRERGHSAALLSLHSMNTSSKDGPAEDSPKHRWKEMVDTALARDPGYFTTVGARMEEASQFVGKGMAAYSGLKVNRRNSMDLDAIYTMRYRAKELMSVSSGSSFKLLQTIVGQFLRWCISAKILPKDDGWKNKALFIQMGKEDVVQVFINHFITTSAPSTVASKCNALQIVAKCASLKFSDNPTRIRIARVSLYLKSAFNAAKCSYREKARQRQNADERIKKMTIVTGEQTQKGLNLACAILKDIMDSFSVKMKKKGQHKAMDMFLKSQELVDKWCLNFLGLVTLSGGGQRPQAYARLKCPPRTLLDDSYEAQPDGDDTFSLETFREKTARALDMPFVVFPDIYLAYFAFHVDFIRPVLIGKRHHEPSDIFMDNDPLLLHSRTGEYMTPANITTSIRRFMQSVDPRLTNVTAMTLRASYATSMLHNYRQGVFSEEGLTEDQFLEIVAKQMNTSVEQLRNTYMAAHSKDFKQAMRLFTRHFTFTMNEKDDELDEYVEESPPQYAGQTPREPIRRVKKTAARGKSKWKPQVTPTAMETDEESEDQEEFERRVLFPDEVEETQ